MRTEKGAHWVDRAAVGNRLVEVWTEMTEMAEICYVKMYIYIEKRMYIYNYTHIFAHMKSTCLAQSTTGFVPPNAGESTPPEGASM